MVERCNETSQCLMATSELDLALISCLLRETLRTRAPEMYVVRGTVHVS